MLPVISITDHVMRDYAHNIIVRFESHTHAVDYCTHVDEHTILDLVDIRNRFKLTMSLLADEVHNYETYGVVWSDDF